MDDLDLIYNNEFMKKNFPCSIYNIDLSILPLKSFVERFLNTYGGSSVLCIDYLPYVIFAIDNTIIGGFLLSQNTLSDIVKNTRDIRKFWPELIKLV